MWKEWDDNPWKYITDIKERQRVRFPKHRQNGHGEDYPRRIREHQVTNPSIQVTQQTTNKRTWN